MRTTFKLTTLIIAFGLLWVMGASAQTLPSPNAGFDVTGFIQTATLNAAPRPGVDPAMRGGTIAVNGKVITIPDNSLIQFPASTWTWAQLFDPTAWGPVYDPAITPTPISKPLPPAGRTGLALNDPLLNHFPSYEVHVVGNVITNPTTGTQQYIAGLIVPAAQQGLNGQNGYINAIDYATGRFRVGGLMGDMTRGTLCEINDPVGRFGLKHSPDQRFSSDTNNPTVIAATGFPVCIPRVAPPGVDPDCPITNRPLNGTVGFPVDPFLPTGAPLKSFTMPASTGAGTTTPDPFKMVPLMVGDWIDFSGTLFKIVPAGADSIANEYVSVHTLNAHLGIKTTPGTQPAYVAVEEFLFGVGDASGGPTVTAGNPPTPVAQETSTRVALVAFTTDSDPTLPVADPALTGGTLLGIDVDPATGAETELQFPNGSTALSPPGSRDEFVIDDPIRGRMRWNPAKNPRNPTPGVLGNAVGPRNFYREYILRLTGPGRGVLQLPTQANGVPGLVTGQYRLPIFDYLVGEGTSFGQPWPPFNFRDFGFLAVGQGPTGPNGAIVGRLSPFPAFQ